MNSHKERMALFDASQVAYKHWQRMESDHNILLHVLYDNLKENTPITITMARLAESEQDILAALKIWRQYSCQIQREASADSAASDLKG